MLNYENASLNPSLSPAFASSTQCRGASAPPERAPAGSPRLGVSRLKKLLRGAVLGCALLGLGTQSSCGTTEMTFRLAEQAYTYDIMNKLMIPIPSFPCTTNAFCESIIRQAGIVDTRVTPKCEATINKCVVDLNLSLYLIINFSMDPAFTTGFAQNNADSFRDMILSYALENRANFNIDRLNIHVAPSGVLNPSAPGVQFLDWIGPIPAGMTFSQDQKPITVADGSPAHALLLESVRDPNKPFTFLIQSTIRLNPGDTLPAGQIKIAVTPTITLLDR